MIKFLYITINFFLFHKERIYRLDQTGYCKAEDIEQDDRVMAKLKLLSEPEALLAFDELETAERENEVNEDVG